MCLKICRFIYFIPIICFLNKTSLMTSLFRRMISTTNQTRCLSEETSDKVEIFQLVPSFLGKENLGKVGMTDVSSCTTFLWERSWGKNLGKEVVRCVASFRLYDVLTPVTAYSNGSCTMY